MILELIILGILVRELILLKRDKRKDGAKKADKSDR